MDKYYQERWYQCYLPTVIYFRNYAAILFIERLLEVPPPTPKYSLPNYNIYYISFTYNKTITDATLNARTCIRIFRLVPRNWNTHREITKQVYLPSDKTETGNINCCRVAIKQQPDYLAINWPI